MSHANTLGSVPVPAPSASRLNEKATAQEPDSQWVACCKCGETVPFSLERTVGCLQTPSRYFDTSLALVITITCMCAWVCALNNEHTHTDTQRRSSTEESSAWFAMAWPTLRSMDRVGFVARCAGCFRRSQAFGAVPGRATRLGPGWACGWVQRQASVSLEFGVCSLQGDSRFCCPSII